MPESVAKLEQALRELTGRRHCILVGRATAAIYLALKAMPAKSGKVIMPAILCPSPASAALYAGFTPIFADVDPDTFNLSLASLRQLLATEKPVAVVAPHLYGRALPMKEISAICKQHGVFLIDDAAQAYGGFADGQPVGSSGDVSILSFGHTKLLDLGHGGAVLTDDDALARSLRAEEKNLPPRSANFRELAVQYREEYYRLYPQTLLDERKNEEFLDFPARYRDLYLFAFDPRFVPAILNELPTIPRLVAERQANAEIYSQILRHPDLLVPSWPEGNAPWRFSFRLKANRREEITQRLRAEKIDVSHWYPSLQPWYAGGRAQDPSLFPGANLVAREIMNLWVDLEPEKTKAVANRLIELLGN